MVISERWVGCEGASLATMAAVSMVLSGVAVTKIVDSESTDTAWLAWSTAPVLSGSSAVFVLLVMPRLPSSSAARDGTAEAVATLVVLVVPAEVVVACVLDRVLPSCVSVCGVPMAAGF